MHTIKLFIAKQVYTLMSRLCLICSKNSRYIMYITLLIIFCILLLSSIILKTNVSL